MWDILSILINDNKRAQVSRGVRGTRGYHYLVGVAQTPKLSRILDVGNHVLNRLGDHGLKRSRGDVVKRERGRIRATASFVVWPLFCGNFAQHVLAKWPGLCQNSQGVRLSISRGRLGPLATSATWRAAYVASLLLEGGLEIFDSLESKKGHLVYGDKA